ncbi:hypothetical protein HOY80DRAFT_993731 [Tuber brumale]|nr:hypothetical protein HOY80DRAFT_993731 [Tuber brumale]
MAYVRGQNSATYSIATWTRNYCERGRQFSFCGRDPRKLLGGALAPAVLPSSPIPAVGTPENSCFCTWYPYFIYCFFLCAFPLFSAISFIPCFNRRDASSAKAMTPFWNIIHNHLKQISALQQLRSI